MELNYNIDVAPEPQFFPCLRGRREVHDPGNRSCHYSLFMAIRMTFLISGIYVAANTADEAQITGFLCFSATLVPAINPIENRQNFVSAKSFQLLFSA